MKPFDLKRALAGDPVVTRDGKKVLRIDVSPDSGRRYPVVAWAENDVGPIVTTKEGRIWYSREGLLFMAPKTKKIWVRASRRHSGGDIKIRTTNDITDWAEGDWRWVSGPVEIEVEDD